MAKKKSKNNDSDSISFEESFNELQEIVGKLEDGNLSLSESLKQYEQGIKRLKQCHQTLNEAEHQIRQLVNLDEEGNLITAEYERSATPLDENPASSRKKRSKSNAKTEDDADDVLF